MTNKNATQNSIVIRPAEKGESVSNIYFKFPNGYTVSIAYGGGAYSKTFRDTENLSSITHIYSAEVAAWDSKGEWLKLSDNDNVAGWQSPEDIARLIFEISQITD